MLPAFATNIACVVLCIACLAGQCTASAEATRVQGNGNAITLPFDERLADAFGEIEGLGISGVVAISHKDGAVVERAFGDARSGGIRPGDVQVDVNSITKTVTGMMVLKLVEQGKVTLETRLGEVFLDAPADKRDITVHQLLTHSAGFADAIGADPEQIGRDEYLARAFSSRLRSKPGERYNYSNVGYSILAAVVEIRSGKAYETFLRDDVLGGLDLPNTGYMAVYDDSRSLRSAEGKTIFQASWGGHPPFWNLVGNGGLISTASEFIRLRQAFTSGRIVSPALVEASQTKHIAEDETGESHYGYGLVVQDHPVLGRFYWHDGGNGVFSAIWVDCVDKGDVLFAAAVDGDNGGATDMMSILQKHLYGID